MGARLEASEEESVDLQEDRSQGEEPVEICRTVRSRVSPWSRIVVCPLDELRRLMPLDRLGPVDSCGLVGDVPCMTAMATFAPEPATSLCRGC